MSADPICPFPRAVRVLGHVRGPDDLHEERAGAPLRREGDRDALAVGPVDHLVFSCYYC